MHGLVWQTPWKAQGPWGLCALTGFFPQMPSRCSGETEQSGRPRSAPWHRRPGEEDWPHCGRVVKTTWIFLLMGQKLPSCGNAKCVMSPGTGEDSLWLVGGRGKWKKPSTLRERLEAAGLMTLYPIPGERQETLSYTKTTRGTRQRLPARGGRSEATGSRIPWTQAHKVRRRSGMDESSASQKSYMPFWKHGGNTVNANYKLVDFNPSLLITLLNVSGLNIPIKDR